jgi:hypothetical protein
MSISFPAIPNKIISTYPIKDTTNSSIVKESNTQASQTPIRLLHGQSPILIQITQLINPRESLINGIHQTPNQINMHGHQTNNKAKAPKFQT